MYVIIILTYYFMTLSVLIIFIFIYLKLKKRELSKVIGASGIEGDKTDDWQVLDCHSFLVHMMLPETRKHLDLESHWSAETRPCLAFSKSDKELSQRMDELLDKYPVPGEYAESLRGTNNISYQGEVKVL
ncbi:RsfS/YbeB/iojap family protein [archaeon]|nr:MAG: RsfS/YbeB/iojap family protein [archaeon]